MSDTTPGLTPSQLNSSASAQWKQIIRQSLADVRVSTPGFLVEDIKAGAQTVTVQIAIQERVRPRSGKAQWWDIPPIVNVPVLLPRGGGYSVTLPLKKGDEGLLIFCDTCFDNWWVNGQNNSPPAHTDPATQAASGSQRQLEVRRHHVHDCGFFPGMWSQPNVLTAFSTTSLQIRRDDSSAVIDVADKVVTVSGNLKVALAAPEVDVTDGQGGTPTFLMTAAWQTWFTVNVLPHITTGTIPVQPLPTTVLKGQ